MVDATRSHVEGLDTIRAHRYMGDRADNTFARFAFYSSNGNMRGVLLNDPSQQKLNQLEETLQLTC